MLGYFSLKDKIVKKLCEERQNKSSVGLEIWSGCIFQSYNYLYLQEGIFNKKSTVSSYCSLLASYYFILCNLIVNFFVNKLSMFRVVYNL